jgi:hypothetical protein
MTLVEVLLGVLLLSMVGALAFSLVLGARRVMERQAVWAGTVQPASACLEVLIQDLACSLIPPAGEAPCFRLTPGSEGSALSCVTAAPPEEGETPVPLSRFRVLRVGWRVEPASGADGPGLVRTARPERVSGVADEKRFRLSGVAGFEVRVYDPAKRAWVESWETGLAGALPPAARVSLTVKTPLGTETLTAETVIPAGMRVGAAAR